MPPPEEGAGAVVSARDSRDAYKGHISNVNRCCQVPAQVSKIESMMIAPKWAQEGRTIIKLEAKSGRSIYIIKRVAFMPTTTITASNRKSEIRN